MSATHTRKAWTADEDAVLRDRFPTEAASDIAADLGRTLWSVHSRAQFLGLRKAPEFARNMALARLAKKMPSGTSWPEHELQMLRERYPHEATSVIAADLGRTVRATYARADKLGLRKTPEFLASAASGRIIDQQDPRRAIGVGTRWRTGRPSWNKGLHYSAGGRSAETRFRPGQKPHTWQPVGTLRIVDGYLNRKVADPRTWEFVHRLVWQAANGPIPKDCAVVFRDRRPILIEEQITVDKLELVTRAELMRRNSIHRYPFEVKQAMRTLGALAKAIRTAETEESEE